MEGLAEMKSAEEWHNIFSAQNYTVLEIIKQAQSDAFHAGKLAGLQEAKEIVGNHFQQAVHGLNEVWEKK